MAKPPKPEKLPEDANGFWSWQTPLGRLRWIGVAIASASSLALIYVGYEWIVGQQQQKAILNATKAEVARTTWSGKILAVRMSGVGDEEVTQLAALSLPDIAALQLADCQISESSLRRLQSFPELATLDLHGTPLSAAAADALTQLVGLKELDVKGCGLPMASIEEIQEAISGIRIYR